MNFENKIINIKPKSLFEQPEFRQELILKKKRIVDDFRPNEKEFTDIYDEEEIAEDLLEIANLEKKWAKENSPQEHYNKEVASLLEGVIADQVEANNWLGENCEIMPASHHDDVKKGVDFIGIFKQQEEKNYLGLGIDVTFASKIEVLLEKLGSIKAVIRTGILPQLKYFRDPETGEHKQLFVPKIIVGSRLSSAEKLIMLWGGSSKDKNKKLQEDSMQSKIILESLYQLRYFSDYAVGLRDNTKEKDKIENYQEIAKAYAEMYNILYDVYVSKKDLIEKHIQEVSDDIVYQTIAEYTGNTEKEEK